MSQGYFNFCPFRDQILFLDSDGKVERFHITGPSSLKKLEHLGSKGGERIMALTSCGSTIITCHTELLLFYWPVKSTLRLQSSIPTAISDASFYDKNPGPMFCDIRSKILIVCDKHKNLTGNAVFIYNF
jgi:hypothetical protein